MATAQTPHPWNDLSDLTEVHACDVEGADSAIDRLVTIKQLSERLIALCAASPDLEGEVGSLASGVEAEIEDLDCHIAAGAKARNAADDRRFDKCRTRLRALSTPIATHVSAAE